MINTFLAAMQSTSQNVDVSDVKAAATIFITNLAAYHMGDLIFQVCVGLGTAVLLWMNIWGKYLDNQLKKRQIEDHDEAERERHSEGS